jgi:hypothetical protein
VLLQEEASQYSLSQNPKEIQVIMSILSKLHVPNCIVRAEVSCPIADLQEKHIENHSTLLNVSFKQFKLPSRTTVTHTTKES